MTVLLTTQTPGSGSWTDPDKWQQELRVTEGKAGCRRGRDKALGRRCFHCRLKGILPRYRADSGGGRRWVVGEGGSAQA